jgi:putative hydrolase of the HAD superfamily
VAPRAVIFDLGHTLWDFVPDLNLRKLSILRMHARLTDAHGAAPPPGVLDAALHDSTTRLLERWSRDHDDLTQESTYRLVDDAMRTLRIDVDDELLGELTEAAFGVDAEMPYVEPDTLAALGELQQRDIQMACVTNTILLDVGIHDVLERLGLHRYIQHAVVSSAEGYRKPHASLFLQAAEALGCEPDEAVFVGDRLHDDIAGAKAVGMRAVLTRQYRRERLEDALVTPDGVIRRLAELPDALEAWGLAG